MNNYVSEAGIIAAVVLLLLCAWAWAGCVQEKTETERDECICLLDRCEAQLEQCVCALLDTPPAVAKVQQ